LFLICVDFEGQPMPKGDRSRAKNTLMRCVTIRSNKSKRPTSMAMDNPTPFPLVDQITQQLKTPYQVQTR
ncbi:MAG: hypothetical protein AAFW95_04030, partial [Cyanobacteria bacterium J06638_6]